MWDHVAILCHFFQIEFSQQRKCSRILLLCYSCMWRDNQKNTITQLQYILIHVPSTLSTFPNLKLIRVLLYSMSSLVTFLVIQSRATWHGEWRKKSSAGMSFIIREAVIIHVIMRSQHQNEVVAAHACARVIWGSVFTRPRRVPHLALRPFQSSLSTDGNELKTHTHNILSHVQRCF